MHREAASLVWPDMARKSQVSCSFRSTLLSCLDRKRLHPLGTEPLPASAALVTVQAKKEENLFWHPFFLVLWHGPLLPQYDCLSVNCSARPRPETNTDIRGLAQSKCACKLSTLWKIDHTPASYKHRQCWQITICKEVPKEMQQQFH